MRNMKIIFAVVTSVFLSCATAAAEDWKEHRGRHFLIYYKDAPQDFVLSVEKAAEDYYQEITDNLGFTRYKGWTWEDRSKIYIYRDQDDYVESSRLARWSHGAASARDRVIRTFPSAHGFFDSTLPHELGHIIFREFIGQNTMIPLWLEEGVAMYQERAKRWGANKRVLEAIESGEFIPLPELSGTRLARDSDEALVDLFYAESASIVYFLLTEHGKYRFVNFCKKLKDGDSFLKAFREAYIRFKSIEHLNDAWVSYLKQ